jgi:hypothetical protein
VKAQIASKMRMMPATANTTPAKIIQPLPRLAVSAIPALVIVDFPSAALLCFRKAVRAFSIRSFRSFVPTPHLQRVI